MLNRKITMIPGPTPVHDDILDTLSLPTLSHQAPVFVEEYKQALIDIKQIFHTEKAQPFVFAGSGTLAMEMSLVNLTGPNDRVLLHDLKFPSGHISNMNE